MRWTWPELWGFRAGLDGEWQSKVDEQIGFRVHLDRNELQVERNLNDYLTHCSITDLKEFLTGAPDELFTIYSTRLPSKVK